MFPGRARRTPGVPGKSRPPIPSVRLGRRIRGPRAVDVPRPVTQQHTTEGPVMGDA